MDLKRRKIMKTYFRNAKGEFITAAEFFKNSQNSTFATSWEYQFAAECLADIEKNFRERKTEIALYLFGAVIVEFDDCSDAEYLAIRPNESGRVRVQNKTLFQTALPRDREAQFNAIMAEIERLIAIQRSYAARATAAFVEVP